MRSDEDNFKGKCSNKSEFLLCLSPTEKNILAYLDTRYLEGIEIEA